MFTNLIYPRFCLNCKKNGKYICPSCLARVNFSKRFCPYCRKPSVGGLTHQNGKNKTPLDGVISVYKYEGIIRKVIHQLTLKQIGKGDMFGLVVAGV